MSLVTALEIVKRTYRPWWFIVFPEGTRMTPQKLIVARDYATSQKLHIPKNVLVPRTKGFVSIVKYSRKHFQAVYDLTLVVPHGYVHPTIANVLKGEETAINIHIKRYPIKKLPETDENVAMWCRERFCEKDAFLDKYMVEGTIDGQISRTIGNKKHVHPLFEGDVTHQWQRASVIAEVLKKETPTAHSSSTFIFSSSDLCFLHTALHHAVSSPLISPHTVTTSFRCGSNFHLL
ncbi:hypothetical protein L1987_75684 [Smallanthus sonchifolius]|uniref:Uncharacterized protein n=1 Tax=Smallanthus sonchifolius TaxID=185202 RepID=A0ACB9A7F0_9ASTR|nr:hypothetical protein L1987_75684 [Smallanthus sonchifolius]